MPRLRRIGAVRRAGLPQVRARNLEAERMITRYFWGLLVPALVLITAAVVYLTHAER